MNFLDPKTTNDGRPYGPSRFKEIVKECYLISKNCNTSYSDLLGITPLERTYLLEFIADEIQQTQEAIKNRKSNIDYYNR